MPLMHKLNQHKAPAILSRRNGHKITNHGDDDKSSSEGNTTPCVARISELASHSVSALLHLRFLDLSGNRLSVLHPEALRILDSPLQELNLSHALFDPRALPDLTTALRWGDLRGLLKLDLSGNSLSLLSPGMFTHLPSLQQLFLHTNALSLVYSGTFSGLIHLKLLDLRENHFKTFQKNALTELQSLGDIRILLGENPFSCSCDIRAFVSWLNSSKADVDVESIRCSSPKRLAEFGLRGLGLEAIGCVAPSPDITDLTLQTSYVFLGLVLGFVGMVFLFVLYLNRKGMKKWIIETRDACQDVLEGYHYRYEIDTDPRRASASVSVESGSMQDHSGLSQQLPTDTCINRASTSPPADVCKPNMIC
uniref:LRRCT domain-containing protein n=1 Tax=Knipowitschia caucasica TaxID=637954 RepID=A0AAV2ME46_KNICA